MDICSPDRLASSVSMTHMRMALHRVACLTATQFLPLMFFRSPSGGKTIDGAKGSDPVDGGAVVTEFESLLASRWLLSH